MRPAKQPRITVGKVTTGGSMAAVNIENRSEDLDGIPNQKTMQAGDSVVVLYMDDDNPIVLGRAGGSYPS